jgi:hypothetical protein
MTINNQSQMKRPNIFCYLNMHKEKNMVNTMNVDQ